MSDEQPLTIKEGLRGLMAVARVLDRMTPAARIAAINWLVAAYGESTPAVKP